MLRLAVVEVRHSVRGSLAISMVLLASACGYDSVSRGDADASFDGESPSSEQGTMLSLPSTEGALDGYEYCIDDQSAFTGQPQVSPWPSDCGGSACVDSEAALAVLTQVTEALERSGVANHYAFIRATDVDPDTVALTHIVTIDWFKSWATTTFPVGMTDDEVLQAVRGAYCLDVPELRPVEDVEAAINACLEARPVYCGNTFSAACEAFVPGYGYGTQGQSDCFETLGMSAKADAVNGGSGCGALQTVGVVCQ